jgi:hypothetical protein
MRGASWAWLIRTFISFLRYLFFLFIASSDLLVIYGIVSREFRNTDSRVIIVRSYGLLKLPGELVI